jgi:hypothetical protein
VTPKAREVWETPLDPDEFARRLALALAETEEIERARELCAWFRRRYPSARERLAYARRKHEEWTRPAHVCGGPAE